MQYDEISLQEIQYDIWSQVDLLSKTNSLNEQYVLNTCYFTQRYIAQRTQKFLLLSVLLYKNNRLKKKPFVIYTAYETLTVANLH